MAIGTQGWVAFQLQNNYPVVQLQVRFGGIQVVGEIPPPVSDLRASYGLRFSVPRTPGVYNMTVHAMDDRGCSGATTVVRPVTVR